MVGHAGARLLVDLVEATGLSDALVSSMKVVELPEDWSPSVELESVGWLEDGLDAIARVSGIVVHRGEDDFSSYRAVHLMIDNAIPSVFIQHDNAPECTYAMLPPETDDPDFVV